MNVQTKPTGLIEWRPDRDDRLCEVGWVGALTAFRLHHFGEVGLHNFRHVGYQGYVDTLLVLKDGTCLLPLNERQQGSHFTYFMDVEDARMLCQVAVDALASNFVVKV